MPTPQEKFEQEFRKAITEVKNRETFIVACDYLARASVENINSVGSRTNKSSLNYAVEFLLRTIVATENIDIEIARYKLRVIDELLAKRAALSALEHPETKKIIQELTLLYNAILKKIPNISESEQKFMAIFFGFNEQQQIARRLAPLKELCRNIGAPSELISKPLLLCENHNDIGVPLLLNALKADLVSSGYTTLCLEWCYESNLAELRQVMQQQTAGKLQPYNRDSQDQNINELVKFATQSEFTNNLVPIDPKSDYSSSALLTAVENIFLRLIGVQTLTHLRNQGMILQSFLTAIEKHGKIIIVVGAEHGCPMIRALNALGIQVLAVAAMVDVANFNLRQLGPERYVTTKPGSNMGDLFELLECRVLNLQDSTKSAKVLQEFAAQYLKNQSIDKLALKPVHLMP